MLKKLKKIGARLPEPAKTRIEKVRLGETALQQQYRARVRRVAARRKYGHEAVLVSAGFSVQVAKRVTTFDAHSQTESTLAAVKQKLKKAKIEFLVLPPRPTRAAIIVINQTDHLRALRCLRTFPDHWAVSALGRARGESEALRMMAKRRYRHGFRMSETLASDNGQLVSGIENGIDIQFWDQINVPAPRPDGGEFEVGTLVAPLPNTWVSYVEPGIWQNAQEDAENELPLRKGHLFDVNEPIDIVYTWVNGDDPKWQKKKAQYENRLSAEDINESSYNISRFASRDELKFSLRSVEMFASWINHIYIVTDGQVPEWMDQSNRKITIIDHREIFRDKSVLPVFNSHAIEAQLHRIPGLSERYIYLNDDIFFGRRVSPDHFFYSNGISKFFLSNAVLDISTPTARDLPVMSAAKNNRLLIEREFGRTVTNKFKHTPHPQLREINESLEEKFPSIFEAVSSSRFRHPDDYSIPSALHHYYAFGQGKAVPSNIRYFYLDLSNEIAERRLAQLLTERSYDVFCLNDTISNSTTAAKQDELLSEFLPRYFPIKSSFEL